MREPVSEIKFPFLKGKVVEGKRSGNGWLVGAKFFASRLTLRRPDASSINFRPSIFKTDR
jgi:hypothetical protein